MRLSRVLTEKRPQYYSRHDKIILLHDNTCPHVTVPVKNYLKTLDWEVLLRPPYSPDIGPSIICSGQWYMLCQSNGLHHIKILKVRLIRGQPQKIRSSSDLESQRCLKDGKNLLLVMDNTSIKIKLYQTPSNVVPDLVVDV
ncbi:Mariner Mos1 transposase [Eumeta japonica]|uniref:Mariner Mos1 transposase n=1 Tax=Eumeta variegata TaxID=151549 RepID=A0A4C1VN05_EUMVA|nr:Mariner Mos1 transposase [Eumeta japonica]